MPNLTNLYGLPDALVAAIKNDPYTGGGDISVTKLIDAPQRRALYKQFSHAVVEDVSDLLFALMGQGVHVALERGNTSALVEQRLYMEVAGWKLSGQFDRLHLEDRVLQDYKLCSVFKASGDVSWERQLNVLRLLAKHNGYEVHRLEVVAIFRDWRRSDAKRKKDYPQQPITIIDVPVWSDEETLSYVKERIHLHQLADGGADIPCTDEERWFSGTRFALMKNGAKRAIKVADTREELGEPAKGHFIEERKGVYRRCEYHCNVAKFCPQWQKTQQETVNNEGE